MKTPENREDTVKHQWEMINNMGDYFTEDPLPERSDLIVNVMVGYDLNGEPRENLASLINRTNSSTIPILSLDVPSMLDATNGTPYPPAQKLFRH